MAPAYTNGLKALEVRKQSRLAANKRWYAKNKYSQRQQGRLRAKRSRLNRKQKRLEEDISLAEKNLDYVGPRHAALKNRAAKEQERIVVLESELRGRVWTKKTLGEKNGIHLRIRKMKQDLKMTRDELFKAYELKYSLERHHEKLHLQLEQTSDALAALQTDEDNLKRNLDINPPLTRVDQARIQQGIAALPKDLREIEDSLPEFVPPGSPLPDSSDDEFADSPLPESSDNEHEIPIATSSDEEEEYMADMHAPDVYCGDPNCALSHLELPVRLFFFHKSNSICLEWTARFTSYQSTWYFLQDPYLSALVAPETSLSIYNPVTTDWDPFFPDAPRHFGLGEPMVIRPRHFIDSDCRHIHAFIRAVHHFYAPGNYPFGPVPDRYQWVNNDEESDDSMEGQGSEDNEDSEVLESG